MLRVVFPWDVVPAAIRPSQRQPVVMAEVMRIVTAAQPLAAVHDDDGKRSSERETESEQNRGDAS
jgi:hypothetical protein